MGEIGYITDKEAFEKSVKEIINRKEDNKLYTTIEKMPEYRMTFLDKSEEANNEIVLAKIEESAETTYKLYAVTLNGEEKATVKSLQEAETLVKELSDKYEDVLDTKIAIVDVITIEKDKLNLDEFDNNNNLLQIIPNKKNHKFDKDKYNLLLING